MRKKRLCIITSTRAEYGLLKNIIRKAVSDQDIEALIVVTGSHLSCAFGFTVDEIEETGIDIHRKIDIQVDEDSESAVCKTMGNALTAFADYFEESKPDMILILGDRYEMCAIACAAVNFRIPIAHLYGGETTEAAVDEAFRHSITKMSYLHFTSTEEYRKRVIQLGENPSRVYNVGSTGIENIRKEKLLTKNELAESIGIDLSSDYAVGTFHPVTLEANSAEDQCRALMRACKKFPQITFLFTKANADVGGRRINHILEKEAESYCNIRLVDSLGHIRYLSALKYARFVIGNSSSGIVEAPSWRIPTVNIGRRQQGRIQADSIINVVPEYMQIENGIRQALCADCSDTVNPYEKPDTSSAVIGIIKEYLINKEIDIVKKFYDIEMQNGE